MEVHQRYPLALLLLLVANGHKYDVRNCSWVVSNWTIVLSISFAKKDFELTFQKVSHDHIELTDQHGNTIHLMRGDMSNIGENELVPIPGKSAAYNAGFSQGYIGVPLKGHHTQQFLAGYINGTASFQQNKGFSDGYSKVPMSPHAKDYIDAYHFGVKNRVTDLGPSTSGHPYKRSLYALLYRST